MPDFGRILATLSALAVMSLDGAAQVTYTLDWPGTLCQCSTTSETGFLNAKSSELSGPGSISSSSGNAEATLTYTAGANPTLAMTAIATASSDSAGYETFGSGTIAYAFQVVALPGHTAAQVPVIVTANLAMTASPGNDTSYASLGHVGAAQFVFGTASISGNVPADAVLGSWTTTEASPVVPVSYHGNVSVSYFLQAGSLNAPPVPIYDYWYGLQASVGAWPWPASNISYPYTLSSSASVSGITVSIDPSFAGSSGYIVLFTPGYGNSPPAPPVLSGAKSLAGSVGTPLSYTPSATNSPVSYAAVNLPPSLAINPTTGVITGTPTQTGTFFIGIYAFNTGGYSEMSVTLTVAAPVPTITLHSLNETGIEPVSSSDGIDTPLLIRTDASALATQPQLSAQTNSPYQEIGLVADGVTPLLVQVSGISPGAYNLGMTVQGGTLATGAISNNLQVLQNSQWGASSTFTVPASATTAYAAITPITADNLQLSPGATEMDVTLNLTAQGSTTVLASLSFAIRKPPIVLVHGFNTSAASWGPAFTGSFALGRPSEFVIPINYGVTGGASAYYLNTTGRLDTLASTLDQLLASTIESPSDSQYGALKSRWAFTRYDIVGHSQGGLLARILCSENGTSYATKFRNAGNFYRGRFDRVITIGSPHNGSTLVYYLEKLLTESPSIYRYLPQQLMLDGPWNVLPWNVGLNILQSKFDPFGAQITEVNGDPVDPDARFFLISATIDGGEPPGIGSAPYCYLLVGLCHPLSPGLTRGSVVLPFGSDGVVDLGSQEGGPGTPGMTISGAISHSPPESLFGVASGNYETASGAVAQEVSTLLNGPAGSFGRFVMPAPASSQTKAAIDAVIPTSLLVDWIQDAGPSLAEVARPETSASATFNYNLATQVAVEGSVAWSAEAYGPNGISADGISVQANTSDSRSATVTVAESVVGTVVLYAGYTSTDGNLVYSAPAIVEAGSSGTAPNGIVITPSSATLSVGDGFTPTLFGTYAGGAMSQLYLPPNNSLALSSSNPDVVSVGPNGSLAAVGFGQATITATYGGLTAQSVVTISPDGVGTAPPAFVTQPQSATVNGTEGGTTVAFTAAATGATAYLWKFNGQDITAGNASGAGTQTLLITGATAANQGSYTCIANNAGGSATSAAADLTVVNTANPGRLINLSMLSAIGQSLSMGFVNGGAGTTGNETLLIRAVGPSIGPGTAFNVPGVMSDPTLTVTQNGHIVASNIGWGNPAGNVGLVEAADAAVGAFALANPSSLDSAIVSGFSPGAYAATVAGQSGDGGFALTEIYDDTENFVSTDTRLVNLSCLTQIAPGGTIDVGFVIGGNTAKTVLVRAGGPVLNTLFGIQGVMPDPQLQVLPLGNPSEVLAANAGWGGAADLESLAASVGAYGWTSAASLDSAVVLTLAPGVPYAVQVNSVSGVGGTVLIEIYEVP